MSKQIYRKLTDDARSGVEKLLGELERAVMDILWARGETTVREVLDELNQTRSLAYTTVLTVMSRLVEKGLLTQDRVSRAHLYRPALSREAYAAETAGQIVRSLVEDFGDIALAQFSQELAGLDPARLAALKTLLEKEDADE
jgi:predicted transcriptional regulator